MLSFTERNYPLVRIFFGGGGWKEKVLPPTISMDFGPLQAEMCFQNIGKTLNVMAINEIFFPPPPPIKKCLQKSIRHPELFHIVYMFSEENPEEEDFPMEKSLHRPSPWFYPLKKFYFPPPPPPKKNICLLPPLKWSTRPPPLPQLVNLIDIHYQIRSYDAENFLCFLFLIFEKIAKSSAMAKNLKRDLQAAKAKYDKCNFITLPVRPRKISAQITFFLVFTQKKVFFKLRFCILSTFAVKFYRIEILYGQNVPPIVSILPAQVILGLSGRVISPPSPQKRAFLGGRGMFFELKSSIFGVGWYKRFRRD